MYHIKRSCRAVRCLCQDLAPLWQDRTSRPCEIWKWLSDIQSRRFRTITGDSLLQVSRIFLRPNSRTLSRRKYNLLPHLTRQLDYLTQERQHLDTLIATLQKTIQEQKGERNMTIEEKFTGFSYQDNQKIPPRSSREYGQEVMDQALERQKGREDEATEAFNQVFQTLLKISKMDYRISKWKPRSSRQTFRRDSNVWIWLLYRGFLAISAKAMSIIQNSRKISTSSELAQPSTLRMLLPFMSKIKQNKKVRVGQKSVIRWIRFRRPTSAQLSRAVKTDEISVVEPTQPLRIDRQSKNNWEARIFVPGSFFAWSIWKEAGWSKRGWMNTMKALWKFHNFSWQSWKKRVE